MLNGTTTALARKGNDQNNVVILSDWYQQIELALIDGIGYIVKYAAMIHCKRWISDSSISTF